MSRPTYEELEQKVKEFKKEAIEHKRVEALLREKEEHFRNLFHTMSEGVVLISSNGRILQANPASEHILGLSRSGIEGHSYVGPEWQILRPDGTAMPSEEMAGPCAMRERRPVHDMVMGVKRPDGAISWISVNANPIIEEDGTLEGIVATFIDISERKKAEEALRESEERYRTLFENNPIETIVVDKDARITMYNRAKRTSGDRLPHIGDVMYRDYGASHLIDMYQELMECIKLGKLKEFPEKKYKDKYLYISISPFTEGAIITSIDITDRKLAEAALRRRAEEFAALYETSLDIIRSHDLTTLLETIVERSARLLNCASGGLYMCDPDREEVRCLVSYRTKSDFTDTVLKYGEGAAGIVAQTGKPLIIDDYREWSGRAMVCEKGQPFSAVISVPMIWQDEVVGVIHVLHDTETRHFTQQDLELLTLFSNQAVTTIKNAQLVEQTRSDAAELQLRMKEIKERTAELKKTNEELRREIKQRTQAEKTAWESEERYRSLLDDVIDHTQVGIFILDADFRVVWINQALECYFSLQREKVVGKDKRQLILERIRNIFEDPEAFTERIFAAYNNNT